MQNVAESSAARSAAAAANPATPEVADNEAFMRELTSRLSSFNTEKISSGMDRLAAAFPGVDITEQMVGNFQSSATFFLEIEGGTSLAISPEVMEQLNENDDMFDKIKNMIGSLFTAGEEQSLLPRTDSSAVSSRSVVVGMAETRYVEVQRDADTGRTMSLSSLKLQTQQLIADQMQQLFQSIGGGRQGGGQGSFTTNWNTSGVWALLGGNGTMNGGAGKQGEGFGRFVTGSASWEFEGMIMERPAQEMLDSNKRLVGQMDVIIDMWEQSGTTSDLFSYMQVMGLSDPLVFDLGGDGVNLTSAEDGVYFDIKGDGSKPKTGWISGDDAFLYLDETGNGVADSGSELFGDQGGHKNGFEKLAQYDDNADGIIDAQDKVYNDLRLWQDKNGDGINQLEESLTLKQAGIESVDLGYAKQYEKDAYGNVLGERSSFTRTDGTRGQVIDAWLKQKKK